MSVKMVYKGCVRCPACGAIGSNQAAIDRHILRHRDDQHYKIRDISINRLRFVTSKCVT